MNGNTPEEGGQSVAEQANRLDPKLNLKKLKPVTMTQYDKLTPDEKRGYRDSFLNKKK